MRFSTYNTSKMTGRSMRTGSGGGTGAGNRQSLLAAKDMLTPAAELAALQVAEDGAGASPRKKSGRSYRTRPPPVTPLLGPAAARVTAVSAVSVAKSESSSMAAPMGPFPVFLHVGREVKKVMIEPGLSLSMLRMLFVDNFPAIYIRDTSSRVQYELEDVDEVKENVLLSLNIEREFFREHPALVLLTPICSPGPD